MKRRLSLSRSRGNPAPTAGKRRERGSLLIVAMLMTAIIGISIVSFLRLSTNAMRMANRALYVGAAMNISENGLEQAVYTLNKTIENPSYNWTTNGWTISGANAYRKWTGYTFDQNVTGQVQSFVYGYTGPSPRVVSRSIITMPGEGGGLTEKWVEVQLRKTSKFSNGLVAKQSVSFSGNNASVDSYNSMKNNDGTPRAAPVPYSAGVRRDNGSVGSVSVSSNAISGGNANIWGSASTGGSAPTIGSNGSIGPFGTASGTMDPSRVSTDFTANFEAVTVPTTFQHGGTSTAIAWQGNGAAITTTVSLPRGTDARAANGIYYIRADSIGFNNQVLTITDKVVLYLTNSLDAIDIGGGSGELRISPGASLEVYAAGDIKIAGNGIMNGGTSLATANQPANCQFYGTKTSGVQDIQIAGNGVLSAVVYAPQGSIKINGNGDVCGSIVGNDITVVGNAAFHYDESLADLGGNNPFRISSWKELTTKTERDAVASVFSGW